MNIDNTLTSLVDKLAGWLEGFVLMLPNLLVAVLVVVAAWLVARGARRVLRQLMERVSSYRQVNSLIATIGYIAVLAGGTFIALSILDLNKAVTSLLAGAGVIGLALGFAFQDIAANFISGILISVRRPFRHGDIVETNDFMGTVVDVNLRSTVLRTFTGQRVVIPNKEVYQSPLTNYSTTGSRRVDIECGVAYGDDLEAAKEIAIRALENVEARDGERDVEVFYTEFGGSSVNFVARFWIKFEQQSQFFEARSQAVVEIKKAFDENGVTIPYPIRTLDFGVVGGTTLTEALPKGLLTSNGKTQSANADSQ